MPAALTENRLEIGPGMARPLREVVSSLERMGYERVPMVTEVAQFSVRGGIVDVYGFGMAAPARIEWWGDEIESIRAFDLTNQRSGEALGGITILPIRAQVEAGSEDSANCDSRPCRPCSRPSSTLFDLLPGDALIFQEATGPDAEEVARAWREAEHHLELARRLGEETPDPRVALPGPGGVARAAGEFPAPDSARRAGRAHGRVPPARPGGPRPQAAARGDRRRRADADSLRQRRPARATGRAAATTSRCRPACPPGCPCWPSARLEGGFVMPTLRVLTDHEIFRRARRLRRGPALSPGRADVGHRRPHAGRLRGASRPRHRDLSRARHHRRGRRRSHDRGRGGRVRRRRPAQRAALRTRSARALPRRGRRRRSAAEAAPPGRRRPGRRCASAPATPSRRWPPSCSISTRAAASRPASPSRPTPAGSASWSRASSTKTRPTSAAPPRK